jgi:hypothetical protein
MSKIIFSLFERVMVTSVTRAEGRRSWQRAAGRVSVSSILLAAPYWQYSFGEVVEALQFVVTVRVAFGLTQCP